MGAHQLAPTEGYRLEHCQIKRVLRKGSWNNTADNCAVSYLNNNTPDNRNPSNGLRLARSSGRLWKKPLDEPAAIPFRRKRTKPKPYCSPRK